MLLGSHLVSSSGDTLAARHLRVVQGQESQGPEQLMTDQGETGMQERLSIFTSSLAGGSFCPGTGGLASGKVLLA